MVKNLPANAGDMGSIPGLGRFHMPRGQLNLCTTTTQPAHLEPKLPNEKPPQWEAYAPQLERALVHQKDPVQSEINKYSKIIYFKTIINFHSKTSKEILIFLSLFFRWGNWSKETLSNSPRVTLPLKYQDLNKSISDFINNALNLLWATVLCFF